MLVILSGARFVCEPASFALTFLFRPAQPPQAARGGIGTRVETRMQSAAVCDRLCGNAALRAHWVRWVSNGLLCIDLEDGGNGSVERVPPLLISPAAKMPRTSSSLGVATRSRPTRPGANRTRHMPIARPLVSRGAGGFLKSVSSLAAAPEPARVAPASENASASAPPARCPRPEARGGRTGAASRRRRVIAGVRVCAQRGRARVQQRGDRRRARRANSQLRTRSRQRGGAVQQRRGPEQGACVGAVPRAAAEAAVA